MKTLFIEPGSPWENGYNESFNGTLRNELLKRESFYAIRSYGLSGLIAFGTIGSPQSSDGLHLHCSRWLVQCKATESTVSVDVLAREVGMAVLLQAHVIVMITMGGFSATIRQHADQIERTTALQVVLIDGTLFRGILETDSFALIDILKEQAVAALEAKRPQAKPDTEV